MSACLASFVDVKSGNWKRVAVLFIEDRDATVNDALRALELVKKAYYAPNFQLSAEELEELEELYDRVKKAHPELGLL